MHGHVYPRNDEIGDILSVIMRWPTLKRPTRSQDAGSDVLSSNPAEREIELAFLRRIVAESQSFTANTLRALGIGRPETLEGRLKEMQSPVFAQLATELERDVPQGASFGRFRDEAPPSSDRRRL
jgi:hypothetical protein